jgi:hypothetical protein
MTLPGWILPVIAAVVFGGLFAVFGIRFVQIMRDRPRDWREFERRWFGRD